MRGKGLMETREQKYNRIIETLSAGGIVQIVTYTRAIQYDKRHLSLFKVNPTGLYVRHGKRWVCIDYTCLRFGRYKA